MSGRWVKVWDNHEIAITLNECQSIWIQNDWAKRVGPNCEEWFSIIHKDGKVYSWYRKKKYV